MTPRMVQTLKADRKKATVCTSAQPGASLPSWVSARSPVIEESHAHPAFAYRNVFVNTVAILP